MAASSSVLGDVASSLGAREEEGALGDLASSLGAREEEVVLGDLVLNLVCCSPVSLIQGARQPPPSPRALAALTLRVPQPSILVRWHAAPTRPGCGCGAWPSA